MDRTIYKKIPAYFLSLGLVAIIYIPCFLTFLYLDKKIDLDGNPTIFFPVHFGDSPEYALLAENLIQNHVFSTQSKEPFTPHTFRTPGYPLFLAVIYSLFGSYKAATVFQIILVAITGLLIFTMGKKLFSGGVGLASTLCYLMNPSTIFNSMVILSDTFFVFWIILSVYLLFVSKLRNKFFWIFLSGAALGLAILVRPIAQFLPFLFGLFFIWQGWGNQTLKKIASGVFIFYLGVLSLVGPWMIRNKWTTGVWGISAAGFCIGVRFHWPMFFSAKTKLSIFDIPSELYAKRGLEDMDCDLKNSFSERQLFFQYFKKYPIEYSLFHLGSAVGGILPSSFKAAIYEISPLEKKIVQRGWMGKRHEYSAVNSLSRGKIKEVLHVYNYPLGFVFLLEHLFWAFALFLSFVSLFRFKKECLLFLVLIFYFAIMTAPATAPRYRLPIEPFLFLLAFAGLQTLWEFKKTFSKNHERPSEANF